jgi:MFS family permease
MSNEAQEREPKIDTPARTTQWGKLRFLALAGAFSWMGSTLTTFTVALRYKDVYGPIGVSAIMLAMVVPTIIAAPYGGLLADKVSSRILIPSLMTVMGLSSLMLAFDLGFAWSLVFLFITAVCGTPVGAAFSATLPEYSTPDDLPRVNGLMQTGSSLGSMFGPGLAGLLVSATGNYSWPFIIDAVSFWVLAASFLLLGLNRKPHPHQEGQKLSALAGLKVILSDQLVRSVVILILVLILSISVLNVGEVFLVINILHANAFVYGMVSACFALGSMLGAAATTVVKFPDRRHAGAVVVSVGVLSASMLVIAFAWHWAVVAVVWFVAGCFNSVLNAYGVSLVMNRTPEDVRGRVMASLGAIFSMGNVTSMGLGGILLGVFGVRPVFVVAGVICVVAFVVLSPAVLRAANREKAPQAA